MENVKDFLNNRVILLEEVISSQDLELLKDPKCQSLLRGVSWEYDSDGSYREGSLKYTIPSLQELQLELENVKSLL